MKDYSKEFRPTREWVDAAAEWDRAKVALLNAKLAESKARAQLIKESVGPLTDGRYPRSIKARGVMVAVVTSVGRDAYFQVQHERRKS